jgi:hypothetical protein
MSIHPVPKDRRKDTAAYASLPLSTMSKSKNPRQNDEDRNRKHPGTLEKAARPEAPRRQPHKNRAADEPYLVEARSGVNSNRKEF